jgi:translation initiation factor 4B
MQLAKRTVPVEASPSSNSSIFGGAKPVDTAAKEREIEEKLEKQKPEKPQNRSRTTSERSDESIEKPAPAPKSNSGGIFGNARPVDTTKREREIEEKLRKTDINSEKPQHKNESNSQRSRDRYVEDEEKEKKVRSPPPPKVVEEAKPPDFAVSNKYAFLNEDDEVGSGKDESD